MGVGLWREVEMQVKGVDISYRTITSAVLLSLLIVQAVIVPVQSVGMSNGASGKRAGQCYIDEGTSNVRLGNDLIELVFDKGGKGGLDNVLDKATGIDLRGDKEVPPTLYVLFYDTGSGMDAAIQWDANSVTFESASSQSGCTLYINSTGIKGYDIDTAVTITITEGSSIARMRIDVMNNEAFVIKFIFFPLVWGMGPIGDTQTDDLIFFPTGDGLTVKDPISLLDSLYMSDMYPAGASMQFMCHYDPDETGLYLATYDENGNPKKLNMVSLDWAAEKRLASYFQLYPPEFPGNDLVMGYDAVLGTFHGDWHDAAEVYSEWAVTTPFVSGGKVGIDKDTPSWWYDTSIVAAANRDRGIVHNTLPALVEMTQGMSDLTGLDTTSLIFAWEREGGWVGPNFFPPAEGEDEFIEAMSDLNATGDRGFVYMSGTVWRITRGDIGYSNWSYFNSAGRPWAALKENGEVLIDENYAAIDWQCARMCPYTEFWHDMVVDNFLECLRLGIDVVQLDEFPIGTMYPCYNASHGHPVGHSREMSAALTSILNDCRTLGRQMDPDLIMSSEEPCELYIPYLDTYVSRDNAEEYMLYPFVKDAYIDSVQFVPAFGYVYHEFITAFGEPLFLGKSHPELFNDQIKRGLARSLVQGEVVSGGGAQQSDIWPELLELYDRTARAAATYANDYVIKGRMLTPPELAVPLKQVPWYFTAAGKFGKPFNETVVVNGAFRAPDGDIGHILVNWNDSAEEVELELEPYDLGSGNCSVVRTTNGIKEVLYGSVALPVTIHLSMRPNDVVLLEVTRAPDIIIGMYDVTLPATVLTNETIGLDIIVHNGGSIGTGLFDVRLDLEGFGPMGAVQVPSVPAQGSRQVTFQWNTTGVVGTHHLMVSADPNASIPELSENNNRVDVQVQVLERPRSDLLVTVVDDNSSDPLPGCRVVLERSDPYVYSRVEYTNETGQCAFPTLVAGPYRLELNASGHVNRTMEIDLKEGTNRSLTIRMEIGLITYDLTGSITDIITGEPISEVVVKLSNIGPGAIVPRTAMTSVSGTFLYVGLPGGEYRLEAVKDGYSLTSTNVTLSGQGTERHIDIEMIPDLVPVLKGDLKGFVKDARTLGPIGDATVRLVPTSLSLRTGPDGGFAFLAQTNGSYRLNVTAIGYRTAELDVIVVPGTIVFQNITLEPIGDPPVIFGSIMGTISGPDGAPIAGAEIKDKGNRVVAVSEQNGTYSIKDLGPGTYSYTVRAEGFLPKGTGDVEVNGKTVIVNVTLEPIPVIVDDDDDDDTGPFGLGWVIPAVCFGLVVILSIIIIVIFVNVLASKKGKEERKAKVTVDEEE